MDLILAFLNVGGEAIGLGVDPLRKAYIKLVGALWILIGIMLFGLGCNIFGHPGVNIILSSLFAVVTAILWWRPQQVAEVSIVGAIVGNGSLSEGAKWLLGHYYSVFKTVLLVGTTVLFYLGFIPFSANPGAFFVLIAGTIAVSLMADQWNFGGGIGKNLVFYGACVIMSFAVVSLIPQGFWGSSNSFFGEWATSIKAKEGGIFVLALLLTIIFTLYDKRSSVGKESKGSYTVIIWLLFGLMDIMFMPPAFHKIWTEYGLGNTKHVQVVDTPRVAQKQHVVPKRQSYTVEVTAEEGAFTEVKIPDLSKFDFVCPPGTLMVIVHTGIPQGQITDCDIQEKIALSDNLRGLRLGFQSKDSTPKHVTVMITPQS